MYNLCEIKTNNYMHHQYNTCDYLHSGASDLKKEHGVNGKNNQNTQQKHQSKTKTKSSTSVVK